MVHAGQRVIEQGEVPLQRRGRIDIEGRAHSGCNLGQGDVFGVQSAIFIQKMIHARVTRTNPARNQ